jgi:1,4-dihydroxy-2-naphthoate polyprenyltransferase
MLKRYLSFVEIQTKITSVFAFAMALAYLLYLNQPLDWIRSGLFFASMFLFDLTTTGINNYIDTRTNDQILQFKRPVARAIIFIMLAVSTGLGIWLVALTDWVVLGVGGLCFICGVFYTFGPVPISRIPLGEVLSGVFYGLLIPFLLLYINLPASTLLSFGIQDGIASLEFALLPLLTLGLISWAPMVCTANIMLANNICDLEKDILVNRHTLPYYIGKMRAVTLYALLYYSVYVVAVILVILNFLPPWYLLLLVTLIPVEMNLRVFRKKQEKASTFITSIKNFIFVMTGQCIVLLLCGVLT